MFDSINVGMTGLLGYSRGLRVIANNTANMNTPGYKSSSLQFTDLFYTGFGAGNTPSHAQGQVGYGLNTAGTSISFAQGDMRQSGNDLDLAINGKGFFVARDEEGNVGYTRAGSFKFDNDRLLVNSTNGAKIMALNDQGELVPVSLSGKMTHSGKQTSVVKFNGNLSSTATEQTVAGVTVIDGAGKSHPLSLKFTNTESTKPGSWKVEVLESTTVLHTGAIEFASGAPVPSANMVKFTYKAAAQSDVEVTLDFSNNVTSWSSGDLSSLVVTSQDGVPPGSMTGVAFDEKGIATFSYSNAQTVKGARLALGWFDSQDAVAASGDNTFKSLDANAWHLGHAGTGVFGTLRAGYLEMSNVDLSQEFSDLVVMQRGYQASSQVISTANDMIQQLFSMKSR